MYKRLWRNYVQNLVVYLSLVTTHLSKDQKSPMMMFLIEVDPKQAVLTKILMTEQGLSYNISVTQAFKELLPVV